MLSWPAGAVDLLHLGRERHDLVLELAGLLRGGGAALALQRICILAFAADLVAFGDDLGGFDHRHPQRRLDLQQMLFGEVIEIHAAHLHQRDRFDAGADRDSASLPS